MSEYEHSSRRRDLSFGIGHAWLACARLALPGPLVRAAAPLVWRCERLHEAEDLRILPDYVVFLGKLVWNEAEFVALLPAFASAVEIAGEVRIVRLLAGRSAADTDERRQPRIVTGRGN